MSRKEDLEQNIHSNYLYRPFLYRDQVPERILKDQFEYLDCTLIDGFFKYRRMWFHVTDFMAHFEDNGWHGHYNLHAFHAVLIKVSLDVECYMVASQYS